MSIIYSYPEQTPLSPNDMLIGTSTVKVGGKQKNTTRNFSLKQIADFIGEGGAVFNPTASDFQIGVFNQGGTKLTGSIMSQDTFPNGTGITVAGNLTTTNNLTALGDVVLGNYFYTNSIKLISETYLLGQIRDQLGNLGTTGQILLSDSFGSVTWTGYEAGLVYQGTWNGTTGRTNPGNALLTPGVGVNSEFYIVSTAGNYQLNQIPASQPSDSPAYWQIGDWVVFVNKGGVSEWQKIDNTSALTGTGTDNKIAMWTGGATPSVTLADSMIYQDAGATAVTITGTVIPTTITDKDAGVGTAGQILSSTEIAGVAGIGWIDNQVGTVTGTGTTSTLPIWSDGTAGVLGDSILDQVAAAGVFTDTHLSIQGSGGLSTQNLEINKALYDGAAAPGADGQVLTSSTQGADQEVRWVNASTIGDTYDLGSGTSSAANSIELQLTSGSGNDNSAITLTGGTGITVAQTGDIVTLTGSAQGMTGSGTVNKLPKFDTTTSLTDSIVSETATTSAITAVYPRPVGPPPSFAGFAVREAYWNGSTPVYGDLSASTIDLSSNPFGNGSGLIGSFSVAADSGNAAFRAQYPLIPTQSNGNNATTFGSNVQTFVFKWSNGATITFTQTGVININLASGIQGFQLDLGQAPFGSPTGTFWGTQMQYVSGSGTITAGDNLIVVEATSASLDVTTHKIINVVDPTDAQDAATKAYVDASGSGTVTGSGTGQVLSKFSGTGTGQTVLEDSLVSETTGVGVTTEVNVAAQLDMTTHQIKNVVDPTQNQDAVTKVYVDTAISGSNPTPAIVQGTTITPLPGLILSNNNTWGYPEFYGFLYQGGAPTPPIDLSGTGWQSDGLAFDFHVYGINPPFPYSGPAGTEQDSDDAADAFRASIGWPAAGVTTTATDITFTLTFNNGASVTLTQPAGALGANRNTRTIQPPVPGTTNAYVQVGTPANPVVWGAASGIINYSSAAPGPVPPTDSGNYYSIPANAISGVYIEAELNLQNNTISSVADPIQAQDVATRNYVDITAAGSGALVYQTGYNAITNSPDLTTGGTGVLQGFTYAVTAGPSTSFWNPPLDTGDLLIANVDNPTTIADWTEIQSNIGIAGSGATDAVTIKGVSGFNSDDFDVSVNGWVQAKDFTGNTPGYVPDATSATAGTFLKEDGTWSAIAPTAGVGSYTTGNGTILSPQTTSVQLAIDSTTISGSVFTFLNGLSIGDLVQITDGTVNGFFTYSIAGGYPNAYRFAYVSGEIPTNFSTNVNVINLRNASAGVIGDISGSGNGSSVTYFTGIIGDTGVKEITSNPNIVIDSTGKFGIGTDQPSHDLDVRNVISPPIINLQDANLNSLQLQVDPSLTTINKIKSNIDLVLDVNSYDAIKIDTAANVMIGDLNNTFGLATSRLHVIDEFATDILTLQSNTTNQKIKFTDTNQPVNDCFIGSDNGNLNVWLDLNGVSTPLFNFNKAGKLGVGTALPNYTVDIQDVFFDANLQLMSQNTGQNLILSASSSFGQDNTIDSGSGGLQFRTNGANILNLGTGSQAGYVKFNEYGQGNKGGSGGTGVPAYSLLVDSVGEIIEGPVSSGGGTPVIIKESFSPFVGQSNYDLNPLGVNNPQDENYVNIYIDGVYQNLNTIAGVNTSGVGASAMTTVTMVSGAPAGVTVEIVSTI